MCFAGAQHHEVVDDVSAIALLNVMLSWVARCRERPIPGNRAPSAPSIGPLSWPAHVQVFSDRGAWRECLRDDVRQSCGLLDTTLFQVPLAATARGFHRGRNPVPATAE